LRAPARLYGALAARAAARGKAAAVRRPVPVIVVGNITVGGTGKTPLVLWLVQHLRERGWRPGVVSRGYGGRAPAYPLRVTPATDPAACGDEPALLARSAGVPVAVAPDRVAAARLLVDGGEADIIVADDGLQHYRLARDLEICVVDGSRGLGNGELLPAGPLREPAGRLGTVDLVVVNGGSWRAAVGVPQVAMQLDIAEAVALADGFRRRLAAFAGQRVHAVAGIGNPQRFFDALSAAGLQVTAHPFPDHHRFTEMDLAFGDDLPVMMTEKDAVKCAALEPRRLWAVPARARLSAADGAHVQQLLDRLPAPVAAENHG
ncbi:MAG: tetraacyldisaccharide 4'-kinase, partial [Nevskia sp.]|nr:tetraacyldisaccharide 4'-kinase [Nevskia sp.]